MKKIILSVVASALMLHASTDQDLKTEVELLKTQISTLEKRLDKNDSQAEKEKMQRTLSGSNSFNQQDFLPNIALIANMSMLSRDVSNSDYANYEIPGFLPSPGEIPFNPHRGFNLNYGELEISSSVGPYFDVATALHMEKDGVHIGELFVTTKALPYGFRIKAGKFKSNFGRINSKHQHAWNFSTIPLVFETFFGPGGLGDEGIQFQYTLPTDTYFSLNYEAMQGSNARSFGDIETNNLNIFYLKSSFDVTDYTSLLLGATWMHGKYTNAALPSSVDSNIYAADITLKHVFDSYSSLTWQSELLQRDKDIKPASQKQAGLYSELIYKYNQNWATGARYDLLYKNIDNQPDDLDKYSAMLEYKPFEFSKLRLQGSYDRSKLINGERKDITEFLLSLTIEAGSHGAHAF